MQGWRGRRLWHLALAMLWLAASARAAEITIDRQRFCPVIDGEPFFALGCCGIPPEQMAECAEAGFNLTVRWGGQSGLGRALKEKVEAGGDEARSYIHEYLDAAEQAGLRVIEFPALFGYERLTYATPDFEGNFTRFIGDPLPLIVRAVKDHPALFGYYGPDEPGEEHHALCKQYSEAVRAHDPAHPLFFLYCVSLRDWPGVYDIAGLDWYPVPDETPLISVYHAARKNSEVAHKNGAPYWHMPLMHIASSSRMRSMKPGAQRAQVYLALTGGADGIVWWVWPPAHADNWESVKQLVGEMKALTPVLTEPPTPTPVRWEPERLANTVQVRAIRRKDITFLLAANAAETAATVRFTLPVTVKPRAPVWFEDRAIQINGRGFSDRFEPHGRHVYEIHGQWPVDGEIVLNVDLEAPEREDPVRQATRFEENLIHDPGFEGDLCWSFVTPDEAAVHAAGGYDEDSRVGGRRSATIGSSGQGRSCHWAGRHIQLRPNARYSFGGWARAETVGEADVVLRLWSGDSRFSRTTELRISDHAPWRQYSTVFSTGRAPVRVQPMCRFGPGEGKAWFDDMFLVEAPAEVRNMIVNGGFEGPETGRDCPRWWWSIYGLMMPGYIAGPQRLWGLDRDDPYEGERCLRVAFPAENGAAGSRCTLAQQNLAPGTVLRAGQPYVLSAYLKGDRPDLAVVVGAGGWEHFSRIRTTDAWERYSITIQPEADNEAPFVQLQLEQEGTLWIDAVQFEEGAEPTEYREWRE